MSVAAGFCPPWEGGQASLRARRVLDTGKSWTCTIPLHRTYGALPSPLKGGRDCSVNERGEAVAREPRDTYCIIRSEGTDLWSSARMLP